MNPMMAKVPTLKPVKQENAQWTIEMEKELCDLLIEQIQVGNRPSAFVKSAWTHVKDELNMKTGKNLTMDQIKNRYNLLRIRYRDFKKIMGLSGFGWNSVEKMVTVDNDGVWEAYLKEYPDHKKYKTSGCPLYDELGVIFGDTTASGSGGYASAEDKVRNVTDLPNVEYIDVETPNRKSRQGSSTIGENEVVESSTKRSSDSGKRKVSFEQPSSKKESKSSGLSDALLAIAEATKSKYVGNDPETDPYSIPNCTKHLQSIDGVSMESVMAALEKFQDQGWRQAFMSLDLDFQKEWLKKITK